MSGGEDKGIFPENDTIARRLYIKLKNPIGSHINLNNSPSSSEKKKRLNNRISFSSFSNTTCSDIIKLNNYLRLENNILLLTLGNYSYKVGLINKYDYKLQSLRLPQMEVTEPWRELGYVFPPYKNYDIVEESIYHCFCNVYKINLRNMDVFIPFSSRNSMSDFATIGDILFDTFQVQKVAFREPAFVSSLIILDELKKDKEGISYYRDVHNGRSEDREMEDKGSEDKGSEYKGSEDKGSEDKGSEDKGSEDREMEDNFHVSPHHHQSSPPNGETEEEKKDYMDGKKMNGRNSVTKKDVGSKDESTQVNITPERENNCMVGKTSLRKEYSSECLLTLRQLNLFNFTAVIVQIGSTKTSCTPVINGIPLPDLTYIYYIGGYDIDNQIFDEMKRKEIKQGEISMDIAKIAKEKRLFTPKSREECEYLSILYETEPKKYLINSFELRFNTIYSSAVNATEIFFSQYHLNEYLKTESYKNMHLYDTNFKCNDIFLYTTLQEAIYNTIQKCPIDFRKELFKHIYLTGGCSIIRGFRERLQNELYILIKNICFYNQTVVHVHILKRKFLQKYCVYSGSHYFLELFNYDNYCVTRQDYEEYGENILEKFSLQGKLLF
ncbi:actin-like protein, putative (ALP5a) [Plasmodium ovale wallikeri]|uniref:Actin-like protein, putative n=2 Tax=Plasmodium ovale TaxID=36330 RepID=A0A1C3KQE7_PLAOA|nr:actin-like protein, putative (ALP5a) [Plasmodium ovale wallikeri]SBT33757.1 actin-like protein, putative (ALP5a) [Plasmodium ovale wallikeri]SBT76303.1 actin-like protein, putative [Plasmodium ovale]